MVPGRIDDPSDLVLQHHRDGFMLRTRLRPCVGDQEDLPVLPCGVLRSADQGTCERGRSDAIGDDPEERRSSQD